MKQHDATHRRLREDRWRDGEDRWRRVSSQKLEPCCLGFGVCSGPALVQVLYDFGHSEGSCGIGPLMMAAAAPHRRPAPTTTTTTTTTTTRYYYYIGRERERERGDISIRMRSLTRSTYQAIKPTSSSFLFACCVFAR